MSKNLNKAFESLSNFDAEPLEIEPDPFDKEYCRRMMLLDELEHEAWDKVKTGELNAMQAEEVIWKCVEWVESVYEQSAYPENDQ